MVSPLSQPIACVGDSDVERQEGRHRLEVSARARRINYSSYYRFSSTFAALFFALLLLLSLAGPHLLAYSRACTRCASLFFFSFPSLKSCDRLGGCPVHTADLAPTLNHRPFSPQATQRTPSLLSLPDSLYYLQTHRVPSCLQLQFKTLLRRHLMILPS